MAELVLLVLPASLPDAFVPDATLAIATFVSAETVAEMFCRRLIGIR